MNRLAFIAILSFILMFSCGQTQFSSKNLIGRWEASKVFEGKNSSQKITTIAVYHEDGMSYADGVAEVYASGRRATYEFKEVAKWIIKDNRIVERPISIEFCNYGGDNGLAEYVRDMNLMLYEDLPETVVEIVEFDNDKIVVNVLDDEVDPLLILHRVK